MHPTELNDKSIQIQKQIVFILKLFKEYLQKYKLQEKKLIHESF